MTSRAGTAAMASRDALRALIDRLLDAGDAYAALGAYRFADAPDRQALEAVILATPRLGLIFAAAPYAPAGLLDRISIEANAALRLRLAKNPATPPGALARLLTGDAPARLRRTVAAHPGADAAILSALASDPSVEVRRAVAGNPAAPGGARRQSSVVQYAEGASCHGEPEEYEPSRQRQDDTMKRGRTR